MALINCPACGKRMYTLENSCPHCGHRERPPAGGGLRARPLPPAPRRRFHSLSVRSAVPGSVDADAWIRFWANLCGGMLVVGFFFPMIFSGYRTTTVIWPWDLMSAMKAHQKLGMLLPLTLGLGAIAIGNLTRGLPRAIALSVTAGSVWVLYALLAAAPEMDLAHLSAKPGSGVP